MQHVGAYPHRHEHHVWRASPNTDPLKSLLYGRALVVIAAEQYASRLVVPQSQQHSPVRWSSHKDQARKALAKLVGPHLPATLKQVEKAVAKAHAEHEKATKRQDPSSRTPAGAGGGPEAGAAAQAGAAEDDWVDAYEYQDGVGEEDLDDVPDIEDDLGDVGGIVGLTAGSTPTQARACSCRVSVPRQTEGITASMWTVQESRR